MGIEAEEKLSARFLMTSDFIAVREQETVGGTLDILHGRKSDFQNKFAYLYVVSEEGELCGVLGTRDLLAEDSKRPISEIMKREVLSVSEDSNSDQVLHIFRNHPFFALPVTDRKHRLIGIIPAENVEKYLKRSERPARGQEGDSVHEEIETIGIKEIILKRMPWFMISLTSGLMCAYILGIFIGKIESVIALILFVPIVLGLAGGVGTQLGRITIRELRKGSLRPTFLMTLLLKEVVISFAIAVIALLISSVVAVLWRKMPIEGIAFALSIIGAMTVSGILAIIAPVLLRLLRMDSGFVPGLFTLLICDIVALVIYFLISLPLVNPMIELG